METSTFDPGPWVRVRVRVNELLRRGDKAAIEEAAVLVAEADWRSAIPADDVVPEAVWAKLRAMRHPLGWLRNRFKLVEHGGEDNANNLATQADLPAGQRLPFELLETNAESSLAAFVSMCRKSNGSAKSVAVRLKDAETLNCETALAVARYAQSAGVLRKVEWVSADKAVASFVRAGVAAGIYHNGSGAAFGRLYAWRTICWLLGSASELTMNQALDEVARRQWCSFSTERFWLYFGAFGCYDVATGRFAMVVWSDVD